MKQYEITEILKVMASEGRRYFSPLYVCKRLNTEDKDLVTKFLFSEFCKDIIRPNFEIECPNGDTDFIVNDLDLIPMDEVKTCDHCGIEYLPDKNHIWITFDFTKDYIEYIKNNVQSLDQIQKKKISNINTSLKDIEDMGVIIVSQTINFNGAINGNVIGANHGNVNQNLEIKKEMQQDLIQLLKKLEEEEITKYHARDIINDINELENAEEDEKKGLIDKLVDRAEKLLIISEASVMLYPIGQKVCEIIKNFKG